jgi:hypothetical protein
MGPAGLEERMMRKILLLWLLAAVTAAGACGDRTIRPDGDGDGNGNGNGSGNGDGQCQRGVVLLSSDELNQLDLAKPAPTPPLPEKVDLSPDMPPIGNQLVQKSCVGWAVGYALRSYMERRYDRRPLKLSTGELDPDRVFSPAWIYNQINGGQDRGAKVREGLEILYDKGAARWRDMPYDEDDYKSQPSAATARRAEAYKIAVWARIHISDTTIIKSFIYSKYPVVIVAIVDEGFLHHLSSTWSSESGDDLGPHAMVICGYDDTRNAFRLFNSWGRSWGDRGYSWLDYEHCKEVVREGYIAVRDRNEPNAPTITSPSNGNGNGNGNGTDDGNGDPRCYVDIDHIDPEKRLDENRSWGWWIRVDGDLNVASGAGQSARVEVRYYIDKGGRKGDRVAIEQINNPRGWVTSTSRDFGVPPDRGATAEWIAWTNHDAVKLKSGGTYRLIAEAILIVDGTVKAKSEPYRFTFEP